MDSATNEMVNLDLKLSDSNNNDKWRLWLYECNDLRVHHEERAYKGAEEAFYAKIRQIRAEREANGPPVFEESQARWHLYLTKDVLYENTGTMLAAVEKGIENGGQFSCGTLAKKTYFDKMLGFGFFRAHFKPIVYGTLFRAQLFCHAGDHQFLDKFDQILLKTMQLIKELPEELAEFVHGIMLRSEINPGTKLTNEEEPYGDEGNLPCNFKLDIWITKKSDKLYDAMFAKIKDEIIEIKRTLGEFPCYGSYKFPPKNPAVSNNAQWCLQIYECSDLRTHTREFYDRSADVSAFLAKILQIRAEREAHGIPVFEESRDRWDQYLTEAARYENMEAMLAAFEEGVQQGQFSCDTLAKKTYFDKMHGFGFFRAHFKPYTSPFKGNLFRAFLFCFARDQQVLAKFDQILLKTMHLLKELPEELAECVQGILVRSEINPGQKLTNVAEPYGDEGNLPCRFRLDLWIAKNSDFQDQLHERLVAKIEAEIQLLPSCNYGRVGYELTFNQRRLEANNKNFDNRSWRK